MPAEVDRAVVMVMGVVVMPNMPVAQHDDARGIQARPEAEPAVAPRIIAAAQRLGIGRRRRRYDDDVWGRRGGRMVHRWW